MIDHDTLYVLRCCIVLIGLQTVTLIITLA